MSKNEKQNTRQEKINSLSESKKNTQNTGGKLIRNNLTEKCSTNQNKKGNRP